MLSDQPQYDVAVIGAGPAGISAAVRVRWVKRDLAIPCKVALIDPSPPGGLTKLGTTNMIGPGWIYSAKSLHPHLTKDIERFNIPQIRTRARSVTRSDDRFEVRLEDETTLSARTVILAMGMRQSANEQQFWKRGLAATSLGIEASVHKIIGWLRDPKNEHVVVVGSSKLSNLFPLVAAHRRTGTRLTFIIEPTLGHTCLIPASMVPGELIHGTISSLEGDDRLRRVTIDCDDRSNRVLEPVSLVAIDFLSYEGNLIDPGEDTRA